MIETSSPAKPSCGEDAGRLGLEIGVGACDVGFLDVIKFAEEHAQKVVPDIGVEHAKGAQGAGLGARYVDATAPDETGDCRAMHRSGAATGHQDRCGRIVAPLDADPLHRMEKVLFEESDNTGGSFPGRDGEGLGHAP